MYRMLLCTLAILATVGLTACGQSGALVLPSDPNYDKRSQYLIYPNVPQKSPSTNTQTEQQTQSTEQN